MADQRTLHLRVRTEGELLFVEKLAGFNTHAPDPGKLGIAELLERDLGKKVFVVHRLDKETSGAMVFATTSTAAAAVADLFEKRQIEKRYLFVTDQRRPEDQFVVSSLIDKKGNRFVSDIHSPQPNARTTFRKLKRLKFGDLWEALPETGKPHQIRLHAQDRGIAILGDGEHGGAPFPRLCLHSKRLAFNWGGRAYEFEASNPAWTNDLPPESAVLLDAMQSRASLFDLNGLANECLRLVHREVDFCRVDQFGPQLWVNWYREQGPTAEELRFLEQVARSTGKPTIVRKMQNRGADPTDPGIVKLGDVQDHWEAQENRLKFEFRTDSGQSAGLFLDQRENRWWVRSQAKDRSVLNLFSYTGAFSVAAAAGGAKEVCTVDVSTKFNEWAVRNFELNGLDPHDSRYEFWSQDCLLFLKGAGKRGRKWDLIICDPPSFGRSKEGTFQLHKHLPALLESVLPCLAKGGKLLLSCNYEEWTVDDLRKHVAGFRDMFAITFEAAPPQGLDFERPGDEPLMKSLVVVRK